MGQDLARGRQGAELDVVVERSIRGQTQESNVPPEDQANMLSGQRVKDLFPVLTKARCNGFVQSGLSFSGSHYVKICIKKSFSPHLQMVFIINLLIALIYLLFLTFSQSKIQ